LASERVPWLERALRLALRSVLALALVRRLA